MDYPDDSALHLPLSSAIKRGKPLLASAIFYIHIEFNVPIPDFCTSVKLSFRLLYHEIGKMLLQLYHQNPTMCQDSLEPRDATGVHMSELLSITQSGNDVLELKRRAMHSGEYDSAYAKTLHVLLTEGVNLTEGHMPSYPFANALYMDDIVSVKLYVQHIQDRGWDVVAHLKDPANVLQEGEGHL